MKLPHTHPCLEPISRAPSVLRHRSLARWARVALGGLVLGGFILGVPVACDRKSNQPAGTGATPGASVPSSGSRSLRFVERTPDCGVDLAIVCGGLEKDYIVEVNGSGCALLDHDGDGDLDVFFVNGARFPDDPRASGAPPPSDVLYRNEGNWRFTDVTDEAGLRESAWGCGVAVADIDNDGHLDLFVTNLGPDALWHNRGDGRFEEIAARAGVADPGWGSSATFLDYDRDGLVDLFVVNYLEFDRSLVKPRGPDSCSYKGQQILCGPVGLPRGHASLFRNLGGLRFEDVSERTGIRSKSCYGLGVAVGDVDSDGWLDIYVASDTTENLLFHNIQGERFEEIGLTSGVGLNDNAVAQAGMGTQFAFVTSSEREDLFVTNYEDDGNTFYRNLGDGFFSEATSALGLFAPSFKRLSWATFFVDFDLDADLDLFVASGHVIPQADQIASSPGYRQTNQIYRCDASPDSPGLFTDQSAALGPGFAVKKSSRGAAYGDLDGDGDVDLVISEIDDQVTLLECEGAPLGHWLGVELVGLRSNRAAIGARATLAAGGVLQSRRVLSSVGYASASELTLRFGLGESTQVDTLRVEWPSGLRESFAIDAVDRVLRLEEGSGQKLESPAGG